MREEKRLLVLGMTYSRSIFYFEERCGRSCERRIRVLVLEKKILIILGLKWAAHKRGKTRVLFLAQPSLSPNEIAETLIIKG